jgi:hypothetical protein
MLSVTSLKLGRPEFAVLMGLAMALATYFSALVTYYLPGPIGTATITLIGALAGIFIVYFSTKQTGVSAGAGVIHPGKVKLLLCVVVGIVVFTAVETVGLFYWLQFGNTEQGVTILVETLLIEHAISVAVGVLAGMLAARLMPRTPLL